MTVVPSQTPGPETDDAATVPPARAGAAVLAGDGVTTGDGVTAGDGAGPAGSAAASASASASADPASASASASTSANPASAPADSASSGSAPADSTPADSTPADSASTGSAPADSTPADSASTGSAPADSTPADSASTGSAPADSASTDSASAPASGSFLARAALVTASLSIAGSLLGLVRDQSLARLFGAGSDTDAFLVAWTVPEFAATLLIEDGLAIALIPAFSMALARRARGAPGDPVRALVGATLPRLCLALTAVAVLVAGTAPYLVRALAPGLPDPRLAVDCTRITATCVLAFGLAGYCSAALRAHRCFLAPAAIYVAYNTGIIASMFLLGEGWGVRSAALGVAAGGCLMVAVQVPALWRRLASPAQPLAKAGSVVEERPMQVALVAAVLLFALCRQSQVLAERFLASGLPAGAISHLNYAQKVAQIPMTLSLMVCTVTFPVVARALAEGDTARARSRVERDLALAAALVLVGMCAVIACAPQMIELLFQRGAFTASDTAATADVMRVYALGLLGQTLVGALVRSYFSAGRATWYPLGAMTAGIVVTSLVGAATVHSFGVAGIAAANALGITVTAALLLAGLRTGRSDSPHSVSVRVPQVLAELGRLAGAAVVATLAGAFAASLPDSPAAGLAAGFLTVTFVFVPLTWALGAQGPASALRSLRAVTRRLTHGRFR